MIRRPGGAEFAPSAYVFPGGSVHQVDHRYPDPFRAAALRELFEEVGLLLARRHDGRSARTRDGERLRRLLEGGLEWPEALEAAGLTPAPDRLVPLARWITPEQLARRFDTWFFVANRPPGQQVVPQAGEVEEWLWISPAAALSGDLDLVHVTRRILESIASEDDVRAFLSRLRRRRRQPVAIQPRLVRLPDGGVQLVEEAASPPQRIAAPVARPLSARDPASDRTGASPRPPLSAPRGRRGRDTASGSRPGGRSS
jgi:8-oxo-dGTP pyrophosphatase MutT (NUDIX family)